MRTLGNHFPEDYRQEHVERHLIPGQVLYLFCEFTTPPKEKYLLLVSTDPGPLVFVVNSSVRPFVANRPHLQKCQVVLKASEYDFLAYDSFLDCSQVIDCFREDEIARQLDGDLGRMKGALSAITRHRIAEVVREARTISPRHKRAIERALSCDDEGVEAEGGPTT